MAKAEMSSGEQAQGAAASKQEEEKGMQKQQQQQQPQQEPKEQTTRKKKSNPRKRSGIDHPPYLQMVVEAILSLNERSGSSYQAIAKHIEQQYGAGLPATFKRVLAVQLKHLLSEGKLARVKNSFKLAPKRVRNKQQQQQLKQMQEMQQKEEKQKKKRKASSAEGSSGSSSAKRQRVMKNKGVSERDSRAALRSARKLEAKKPKLRRTRTTTAAAATRRSKRSPSSSAAAAVA